jgi:hypothetical protein
MSMWGSKLVYRKMGYVADFCQICISARPFVLERIGTAKHILNISVGEGEIVDYQRVCLHCGTAFRAEPSQYAAIAKNLDTIEPLMLETFPNLQQAHAPRLALEQQVREDLGAIDTDTRGKLLLEPFQLLSPRVVKRFAHAHFEIAHAYLRTEVIPMLGQTLARLRPTEEELQATLMQLVQMKDLIGAKVKLADLMADLNGRHAGKLPEVAAHPAKQYASGSRPPYRKAAMIFLVLGCLAGVISAILVLVAAFQFADGQTQQEGFIAMLVFIALLLGSLFAIHFGLERQKNWARIGAIVYSVAFLFAVPIGTAIGAYVIWALTLGWEE